MSRNSQYLSTLLSGFCVLVLLAAGMCSAQTAPNQDSNSNSAQSVGDSGAQSDAGAPTIAPIRPPMSYPRAQRLKHNPVAWKQFLPELKQRRADAARASKADAGAAIREASPAFGGTWQFGTNYAPNPLGFTGNPLLLTDGTVIVSDGGYLGNWYKLTPDITGSYVNGTWTQIASMPVINGVQYAPWANASAVLPDGRVVVMGGEYNSQLINSLPVDTNLGAIYDPVANTWTPVSAPAGSSWSNIGDAMSTVLADGTFLLGSCCSVPPVDALFDATNLTWTGTGAPVGGPQGQDEQGYTLLPNGNVLTVDIFDSGVDYNSAEQYDPASGTWGNAGNTGTRLYDICGSYEIGPAPLRPDGTVVQFGGYACGFDDTYPSATPDPTGIYDSTTGMWSAGPDVPVVDGLFLSLADAPGAVLPNGNILFAASPWAGFAKEGPTHFFEFTTANAINQVADAPFPVSAFGTSDEFNFLVLPNGQILVDGGTVLPLFYAPTGSPDPSWTPVISTAPSNIYTGSTYSITGTQLNGLSQGAYYGDDFQMATNYPIVQITNTATSHVFYARSFGFSNRSIAPGNTSSTSFIAPGSVESGPSTLVVIANGIPSAPQNVTILQPGQAVPTITSANNTSFTVGQSGSFTVTTTGTPTPSLSESGAVPSGVSFLDNGNGTGTLSWVPATPVAGAYNITFTAQNGVQVAATQSFTLTVIDATTSIGVTSSTLGNSVYGQSVTFTATVSGEYGDVAHRGKPAKRGKNPRNGAHPEDVSGNVTWSGWPTAATDCANSQLSGNPGTATCTTANLLVGTDTVTATYAGDGSHTGGNGSVGQSVSQANSSTVVSSSQNPSASGQPVSFTATVTPNAPGAGTPTGSVQFYVDGNLFDTETMSSGVNSGSATSVSTSTLAPGPHTVTTIYSGDTNFVGGNGTLSGGQSVGQESLRITPSSLNFGNVNLNRQATRTATVTNISSSKIDITGLSLTLGTADAGAYKIEGYCKGMLKPGQSCEIGVVLTGNEVGTLTATLNINDNAPGSPQQIALTANVPGPVAQFSPARLEFGGRALNSSTTLPLELTNTGQADLTVGTITMGGSGDYSETNDCPASLPPTQSCTFEVTFDPATAGVHGGTLSVMDNAHGGKTGISLGGWGK